MKTEVFKNEVWYSEDYAAREEAERQRRKEALGYFFNTPHDPEHHYRTVRGGWLVVAHVAAQKIPVDSASFALGVFWALQETGALGKYDEFAGIGATYYSVLAEADSVLTWRE